VDDLLGYSFDVTRRRQSSAYFVKKDVQRAVQRATIRLLEKAHIWGFTRMHAMLDNWVQRLEFKLTNLIDSRESWFGEDVDVEYEWNMETKKQAPEWWPTSPK